MGEIVVLSSDDGMESNEETMMSRYKSSEVVQWEKYLPKTMLRVLLVESDESTRQIITALLRKGCYEVVAASNGLAAWEILNEKSHNIDLILTELDLPSISGFALLALVMEHEACKNIPVIMMSSQDSITMVLKCMLRGAADYLIKPIRKNELKNLWQHVWRRLIASDPTVHSLPVSHQNLEDTAGTSADSSYHSDQGSGAAQSFSYNSQKKLIENTKPLDETDGLKDSSKTDKKLESFDVTMDLIGGIDKRLECFNGDSIYEEYTGPELGLSLKRHYSESFKKLSFSNASAFSRYENSKTTEKAIVALDASNSSEPKTPTESHEKLRKVQSDIGSATTSSNQENIGSSTIAKGPNQLRFHNQVESSCLKASKEEDDLIIVQQRWNQREAALMKFRLKRKDRCFDKKVRYQSRKKLAEQRPRVKGQFVRAVNSDTTANV